jgi:hypothetical protein
MMMVAWPFHGLLLSAAGALLAARWGLLALSPLFKITALGGSLMMEHEYTTLLVLQPKLDPHLNGAPRDGVKVLLVGAAGAWKERDLIKYSRFLKAAYRFLVLSWRRLKRTTADFEQHFSKSLLGLETALSWTLR